MPHCRRETSRIDSVPQHCAGRDALQEPHQAPPEDPLSPPRGQGAADTGTISPSPLTSSGQETLDARSEIFEDDAAGYSHHKINQYHIKEEIGHGSYGAVHLATDQFGHEYVRPILPLMPFRRPAEALFGWRARC